MDRLAQLIVKGRWLIIVFFILVTAFFASRLPGSQFDPEMKSMLPHDMPSRQALDHIEELFGGTDMVIVMVEDEDVLAPETLKRVKELSRQVERIPQVDRVLSLFTLKDIRGELGEMYVDPAVEKISDKPAKIEDLRNRLRANDLVYGSVLSTDFRATAVIGMLKADADDGETRREFEAMIEKVPGPGKVYMAGMPIVRTTVGEDMRSDMKRFMPLSVVVLLVFLFLCFKQLRGVVLPFLVVIMSIILAMGLIPILGWKIQIITILLPIMMVAVSNDYGIHLLARYQEMNKVGAGLTSRDLAKGVFKALGKPVMITAVTTIAGFLSLISHVAIPAKQLGVLAAAGIGFALLASLLFIPAMIAVLPMARPLKQLSDPAHPGLIERILRAISLWVNRRPGLIILGILVLVGGIATGIFFVNVDTNPLNYYKSEKPLVTASNLMDKNFGGSTAISVVAEGNIKDPALLREIDDLEKALLALPEVDQTSSIAKVVRKMNKALNDDDPSFDSIPDSVNAVAELFFMYSMSGDPEDFDRLVDFPYEHALLTARINSPGTQTVSGVVDFTEDYLAARPDSHLVEVGGFAVLFSELVDAVVNGQIMSLLLSLVLVGLLVGLLFRSVVAALLSTIPLILSILLLFGLMGYTHIELNIATAMLSSIMIGVGVDYTIHFLWRYRDELARGLAHREAITETLATTGRGIVFNAASVIVGFSIPLVSNFLPVQFFGILVMVTISTCLVGALVLMPAILLLTRPRFLEPGPARS